MLTAARVGEGAGAAAASVASAALPSPSTGASSAVDMVEEDSREGVSWAGGSAGCWLNVRESRRGHQCSTWLLQLRVR